MNIKYIPVDCYFLHLATTNPMKAMKALKAEKWLLLSALSLWYKHFQNFMEALKGRFILFVINALIPYKVFEQATPLH